jgi:hypothetical protein
LAEIIPIASVADSEAAPIARRIASHTALAPEAVARALN